MALESAVFPPDYCYPFRSELLCTDLPALEDSGGFLPCPFDPYLDPDWSVQSSNSTLALQLNELSSIDNGEVRQGGGEGDGGGTTTTSYLSRPKRRRPKSSKNKEDIENQRMTHIAVERNRRKQMNEHLASLRSLMPESYCQRVDQASIIGSAINFVKELEYKLHLLDARKDWPVLKSSNNSPGDLQGNGLGQHQFFLVGKSSTGIADIETSMVESHANLKIRSRRRPKQLLRLITGLQKLRLTVLHLNVHTFDQIVHYMISLKVEDSCELKSADDISSAVYRIFLHLQEQVLGKTQLDSSTSVFPNVP
ncbi:hypothetical protein MLD38_016486 [Melastoma candidum]|uniref:Uncharacterized protein n=1 Tax=Melastoma candidum TaxID=119954 RepID=A0ACB9QRL5_9MYRT|nr:hypothetical protein MLD38_016486 [Melastoma candidum]